MSYFTELFGINLIEMPALPLQKDETLPAPLNDMIGYMAPYNEDVYSRNYAEATEQDSQMDYTCGMNFFHQDMRRSMLHHVPFYIDKIQEWGESLQPGLLKHGLVLCADWSQGNALPKGGILRLSPDEWSHALVIRLASRITANAGKPEMLEWLRCLLSCPTTLKKIEQVDARFAEANGLRNDIEGQARMITFTPRQFVVNVYGFKLKKEKSMGGAEFSAADIAQFWFKSVRPGGSGVEMKKAPLTVALLWPSACLMTQKLQSSCSDRS